jgi:hypothetical protein
MKQAKKGVKKKNRCMVLLNLIVDGLQMYRIKHVQEKKVTASIYYILYRDAGEELYDHNCNPNEWTNPAQWMPKLDVPSEK